MRKSRKSTKFSKHTLQFVASRFRVLGEPMRLALLIALDTGEKNVTALVRISGASQANVSKHLRILADSGMVASRKDGLKIFYFISDPQIIEVCELMCARLKEEFAAKSAHFR